MTIRDYLDRVPDLTSSDGQTTMKEFVADACSIWSNAACVGYVLDAMEAAGIDDDTQERVLHALWQSFDRMTVEEAETKGKES